MTQVILAIKERLAILVTREKQAIQVFRVTQVLRATQEPLVTQEYKEKQALQERPANHRPTTITKRTRTIIQAILEMAIFYGIMQRN